MGHISQFKYVWFDTQETTSHGDMTRCEEIPLMRNVSPGKLSQLQYWSMYECCVFYSFFAGRQINLSLAYMYNDGTKAFIMLAYIKMHHISINHT